MIKCDDCGAELKVYSRDYSAVQVTVKLCPKCENTLSQDAFIGFRLYRGGREVGGTIPRQ
jgi:hypothetical protein